MDLGLGPEKTNLKVFLDRVNVDFTLYVYSDISNFKILQMYEIDQNFLFFYLFDIYIFYILFFLLIN